LSQTTGYGSRHMLNPARPYAIVQDWLSNQIGLWHNIHGTTLAC